MEIWTLDLNFKAIQDKDSVSAKKIDELTK